MGRYRTPLRYPGGKQRLTPFILEILEANDLVGCNYVEPYAGGAGVAMELLLEGKVSHVHLNDASVPIFSFWKSVKSRPEDFCRRISRASLTVEEWKRQREILKNLEDHDEFDIGFATFYLNRCNHSGVLNGGLIGGLSQNGDWKMDARFPRKDLIERIENIGVLAGKIRLRNWDAERFIKNYVKELPADTFVYCDPPYFEKANRLYKDHYVDDDHERIAKKIQGQISQKWIVSYDGVKEILDYYKERRSFLYNLQYNAARAYKGTEVFIFSDELVVPKKSALPHIEVALRANVAHLKPKRRAVQKKVPNVFNRKERQGSGIKERRIART